MQELDFGKEYELLKKKLELFEDVLQYEKAVEESESRTSAKKAMVNKLEDELRESEGQAKDTKNDIEALQIECNSKTVEWQARNEVVNTKLDNNRFDFSEEGEEKEEEGIALMKMSIELCREKMALLEQQLHIRQQQLRYKNLEKAIKIQESQLAEKKQSHLKSSLYLSQSKSRLRDARKVWAEKWTECITSGIERSCNTLDSDAGTALAAHVCTISKLEAQ